MRNAMRELLKNAKANAFENPAHPCPWWAGAENLEKKLCDGPTNGPTD